MAVAGGDAAQRPPEPQRIVNDRRECASARLLFQAMAASTDAAGRLLLDSGTVLVVGNQCSSFQAGSLQVPLVRAPPYTLYR